MSKQGSEQRVCHSHHNMQEQAHIRRKINYRICAVTCGQQGLVVVPPFLPDKFPFSQSRVRSRMKGHEICASDVDLLLRTKVSLPDCQLTVTTQEEKRSLVVDESLLSFSLHSHYFHCCFVLSQFAHPS